MKTTVPALVAKLLSGLPISRSLDSEGSKSAVAAKSNNTIASNKRSTASEASEAANGTEVSRVSAKARAISPARAGTTLFTIIPMVVARHSGPKESLPATGSRIVRQRRARSAKIAVAQKVAAAKSQRFAWESREATSAAEIPRSVQ